ncbi:putative D5 family NTPase/ATPase [Ranavirus ambystoma1]|uniref:Putative D5 familiy NPTase/ATPase n=1 Tax=Ranavirus ambystoma1 TaxID=265294 RepID=A0A482A4H0_9VIRU|nr:putative D5 family NTPase/ATPase [Ambystoma tigrinum virus]QBL14798.1 putative D5 family NTPase/ATPase [Ambystoma tigrinum virus]QBL14906.1 putative D5 family NTPase/ATPase [Ambystoma tigrinum virus]QBL15014.1 putative D5 family NTPase/ATPase [Ambystoma tigrinum virus]QBL15122.1 putative D5 familiy NPTase/ATPase [Ambystoma tigrinum virus]
MANTTIKYTTMDLYGILKSCKCSSDERLTHQSLSGGRFSVTGSKVGEFWRAVADRIESGEPIDISEARQKETPLTLDFDVVDKDCKDPVPDVLVNNIHAAVARWARSSLKPAPEDRDLCGVVLTKPVRRCAKGWKKGFHIQYPKLVLETGVAKNLVVGPALRPICSKVWEAVAGTAKDYLDPLSCTVPWLVYGASKPDEPFAWKIARTLDHAGKTIDFNTAFGDVETPPSWGKPTSDRHREAMVLSIHPAGRSVFFRRYDFTAANPGRVTRLADYSAVMAKLDVARQRKPAWNIDATKAHRLKRVTELTAMLTADLADDRQTWLNVGFCLWQQTSGSAEGYKVWLSFSKKSDKCDEDECWTIWNNQMRPNSFTEGTLVYLAQKHNPGAYLNWLQVKSTPVNDIGTNVAMAKIMWDYYGHQFVCCGGKTQTWYRFDGLTWVESNQGTDLRSLISAEGGPLRRLLTRQLDAVTAAKARGGRDSGNEDEDDEENSATDEDDFNPWDSELRRLDSEVLDAMVKRLRNNLKGIEMTGIKNNVLRECAELFYQPEFGDVIDSDPLLFAFANGVYDFREGCLRDGRPEDKLSRRAPVDFVMFGPIPKARHPDNSPVMRPKRMPGESVQDHARRLAECFEQDDVSASAGTMGKEDVESFSCNPKDFKGPVVKLLAFFASVFPDEGTRRFFLRNAAATFVGGNPDKVVLFWTGTGNNGKTVTQTLFEKMLGCFAVKMSTQTLTGKKPSAGSANPEMARLGGGVRWAVMEEPNSDETINAGTLKSMTGNDSFFARDLYCAGKTTFEIKPMFKLHVICNALPGIKDADQATWNRVRVVPFESTFVTPGTTAPADSKYVFPADTDITRKLDRLTAPLAWYLVYCWACIQNERVKYVPPPKVMEATMAYQKEHDLFRQFTEEMLRKDLDSTLTCDDAYTAFRDWTSANSPHGTVRRPKGQVVKCLEAILGKKTVDGWPGYAVGAEQQE